MFRGQVFEAFANLCDRDTDEEVMRARAKSPHHLGPELMSLEARGGAVDCYLYSCYDAMRTYIIAQV